MEPAVFLRDTPLDITCVHTSSLTSTVDIFFEGGENGQQLLATFEASSPVYIAKPNEMEAFVTPRGASSYVMRLRIVSSTCSDVGVYSCAVRDGDVTYMRYGPQGGCEKGRTW